MLWPSQFTPSYSDDSQKSDKILFVPRDVRKKWFASALADGCELHFDSFQKLEPVFRVKFKVMALVRAVPVKQICYSGCPCPLRQWEGVREAADEE